MACIVPIAGELIPVEMPPSPEALCEILRVAHTFHIYKCRGLSDAGWFAFAGADKTVADSNLRVCKWTGYGSGHIKGPVLYVSEAEKPALEKLLERGALETPPAAGAAAPAAHPKTTGTSGGTKAVSPKRPKWPAEIFPKTNATFLNREKIKALGGFWDEVAGEWVVPLGKADFVRRLLGRPSGTRTKR